MVLPLATLLALAGLVLGPLVARIAAARAVIQPVPQHPDVEARLIAAVLDKPERYRRIAILQDSDFADPALSKVWALIVSACGRIDPDRPDDATQLSLGTAGDLQAEVGAGARGDPLALGGLERVERVRREGFSSLKGSRRDRDDGIVKLGEVVLSDATDRTMFDTREHQPGLEPTGDPDMPLRRRERPVSNARVWVCRLALAAGGALAASAPGTGLSYAAGVLALLVLAYVSVQVASVDFDTFCVDMRVFVPGALAAWVLVGVAAVAAGTAGHLVLAAMVVVFFVAMFETANLGYRLIRGQHGLGRGDLYLLVATVGVPVGLSGFWQVGILGVISGLVCGIGGYAVGAIRGRGGREVPIALGPYLAAGWALAWGWALVSGVL